MPRLSSRVLLPVIVAFLLLALMLVVVLVGRDPDITAVQPGIVRPGDRVEITGRFFGAERSLLSLGGRDVPSSSIETWDDERVVFVVPRSAASGLLYLETERGRSRGFLLRLAEDIPVSGSGANGMPGILALSDAEAPVGGLLSIRGYGFGPSRRDSVVRFPVEGGSCDDCDEAAFYASWSDEEIVVRVPHGVIAGAVTVETPWGISNTARLDPARPAGRLLAEDPVEIALSYGVELGEPTLLEEIPATPGASTISVYLPPIAGGTAQRNIRYLDNPQSTYQFDVTDEQFAVSLRRTVITHRFAVSSLVEPDRVPGSYEDETGFFATFTREEPGIPTRGTEIESVAAEARRSGSNPWLIARAVYDRVRVLLEPAVVSEQVPGANAVEDGYGDGFSYATLFVSAARAALIPSRLVSGVLLSTTGTVYPHFWAEFFVTGVGWVPADPLLGDGGFPAGFPVPQAPEEFYFANLDAFRVAFAHGYDEHRIPASHALSLAPDLPYSLQRVYAVAGPGLAAFTANWPLPSLVALIPQD